MNRPKPPYLIKEVLGTLDYYLKPKLKRKQGGPFNGQNHRQKIFRELIDKIPFSCIVETGTFRGVTTQHMYRESGIPVYSGEVNPRFYGYARTKLRKEHNVFLYNMDSRDFLVHLHKDHRIAKDTFFYLDAHWADDLPLLEEILFIFEHYPEAVVMVDDFQVPNDDQYGYDNYGESKSLRLDYLAPAIDKFGLASFFPSIPASLETGSRRGCVVLARSKEKKVMLNDLDTLNALQHA